MRLNAVSSATMAAIFSRGDELINMSNICFLYLTNDVSPNVMRVYVVIRLMANFIVNTRQ